MSNETVPETHGTPVYFRAAERFFSEQEFDISNGIRTTPVVKGRGVHQEFFAVLARF